MALVLVVNAGSSSLKFAVIDPATGRRLLTGVHERIGEDDSSCPDHRSAFAMVHRDLQGADLVPDLIGHRVVHGGDHFTAPAVIDDEVLAAIVDCVPLAPLHNPAAIAGIEAAAAVLPGVPQVAVFDTAFHTTIPEAAHRYAIDPDVAAEHRLRRYGFHGTSHQFVSQRAAQYLGRSPEQVNIVSLHLGNGASACAIRGGISVETSMGVTPLEGLIMGTRSGDVDPAIPLILQRAGWTPDDVDVLLNRGSGLRALCGDNDMREIHRRAAAGDPDADMARQMFVHRLRKYTGAYLAVLGRTDALVFTAGIGEHDWWVREQVCADLAGLGIVLDDAANRSTAEGPRSVASAQSAVAILVVPTDEECAIATQSWDRLAATHHHGSDVSDP